MKFKIFKQLAFAAACLVAMLPATAQNTATTTGNWNVCATWGGPAGGITKGNDAASAKTINAGVTVTMNTAWNAASVTFGAAGILDFNGTANALDLNTSGGVAQTCSPAVSTITCSSGVQTGTLTSQTASSSVSKTVPYTGGNGSTYSAGSGIASTVVTGLTATLRAGTLTTGTGNLVYDITGTPNKSGTASFAISFGGATCTLTVTVVAGAGFDNNVSNCQFNSANGWAFTGDWKSASTCDPGIQPACAISGDNCSNSTIGTGMAYKNFTTVSGRVYTITLTYNHNGFGGVDGYGDHPDTKADIYNGTATSGGTLATYTTAAASNSGDVAITFTFTATGASSTITLKEVGTTSAGDQQTIRGIRLTF